MRFVLRDKVRSLPVDWKEWGSILLGLMMLTSVPLALGLGVAAPSNGVLVAAALLASVAIAGTAVFRPGLRLIMARLDAARQNTGTTMIIGDRGVAIDGVLITWGSLADVRVDSAGLVFDVTGAPPVRVGVGGEDRGDIDRLANEF